MLTIKDYERFCESEYKFTINTLRGNFCTPKEEVNNAIQRNLGAGVFAQQMGVAYEEVDGVFETYKEKLNNLLKTP